MTSSEIGEIRQQVEQRLVDLELKAAAKAEKVKSVPQEEDLLQVELVAVRMIFTQLEPMSRRGRERVIAHVVEYLQELDARERQDYHTLTDMEAGQPATADGPIRQMEVRRRA